MATTSDRRRQRLERLLAARLGGDTEAAASLAYGVLQALPGLQSYDVARHQYAITRILVVLLTRRLAAQPEVHLPTPGTTLVEALYAEAEAMRSPGEPTDEPWGTFADGHRTGWSAFLGRLRSRADHLTTMGEDQPRPAPEDRLDVEPTITEAALSLNDAIAEQRRWAAQITRVLAWSSSGARLIEDPADPRRPGLSRHHEPSPAVAEVLAALPGLEDHQSTLSRLTAAGEELRDLRVRLRARRGGGGTGVADRRWLNSLAAELRRLADMATDGGGGHPFVSGYTMAGHLFADRLRARADEVAVGRRWTVWRRAGWERFVRVAWTEFEADAKSVVATLRAHGDQDEYTISEHS